jgi:hypothetical protein
LRAADCDLAEVCPIDWSWFARPGA